MAKKIIIYIIVCICATSLNCNKSGSSGPPLTPGGCVWYNAPDPFFFQLRQNGQILPTLVVNNISVAYFDNNVKKYVTDLSPATDSYSNMGIIGSRTMCLTSSGDKGIKVFYIEYYNGYSTDTIYLDYTAATPITNCQYLFKQVKFNGQTPITDTSVTVAKVYIFDRK